MLAEKYSGEEVGLIRSAERTSRWLLVASRVVMGILFVVDVKVHGLLALPVCIGALLFYALVAARCNLPRITHLMETRAERTPGRARARAVWCQGLVMGLVGFTMTAVLGTFALLNLDSDNATFPLTWMAVFLLAAFAIFVVTLVTGYRKYN